MVSDGSVYACVRACMSVNQSQVLYVGLDRIGVKDEMSCSVRVYGIRLPSGAGRWQTSAAEAETIIACLCSVPPHRCMWRCSCWLSGVSGVAKLGSPVMNSDLQYIPRTLHAAGAAVHLKGLCCRSELHSCPTSLTSKPTPGISEHSKLRARATEAQTSPCAWCLGSSCEPNGRAALHLRAWARFGLASSDQVG